MIVLPPIRRHVFRAAKCSLKPFRLWWCAVTAHTGRIAECVVRSNLRAFMRGGACASRHESYYQQTGMNDTDKMDTTKLNEIVSPLLAWFSENARVLPWRSDPTPYHVWVSEIMLQQTRVEAVKPFYARFMEALPEVRALAECPEDQLLKLWEGLGYYNRVRNMQKAAQKVMEQYHGVIPADYEELLTLPGIGHYTAGAVASIAYGQAVPAVDGNVLRVISRICENEEDIMKQSVRTYFEEQIGAVIPKDSPGAFNQSLMELGATVCVPNGAPLCMVCPVRPYCIACEKGRQSELPVKAAKKERRVEQKTVLVIRDSECAAIHRRPKKGLLAGLYELPNYQGYLEPDEVLELLKAEGLKPIRIQRLEDARHIFSHVEWQMKGYLVLVEDWETGTDKSEMRTKSDFLFVEPGRTEQEYPVPAAFAAYMKYLSVRLGQEKYNIRDM